MTKVEKQILKSYDSETKENLKIHLSMVESEFNHLVTNKNFSKDYVETKSVWYNKEIEYIKNLLSK
jgi:hypothetical protein